MMTISNDNAAAGRAPSATVEMFRFLAILRADHVALYWPLQADHQARAAMRRVRAFAVLLDSEPPGPATRAIFGNVRVGRAVVTYAAFARLVAAGFADQLQPAT